MNLEQLYELGRRGYRHLKCHDQLECEAAHPLKLLYPGLITLSNSANKIAATVIADELKVALLEFDLSQDERERVDTFPVDELHSFYLCCEEIIDRLGELTFPAWDNEDLGMELEQWLLREEQSE